MSSSKGSFPLESFSGRKLRFGSFEVDLQQRELRNRGIRVHLQKKPFQILELLLQRPGTLVTRSEMAQYLWPDLHVSFGRGLNTAINTLRQALGDSSAACRFIETRSGLGYRFLAPVEELSDIGLEVAAESPTDSMVILPFENATGDPGLSLLADSVTQSLIANMAGVEQIRVMAGASVSHYRQSGIDPRKIGMELKVRTALTGRIERQDLSLTLATELIDVRSGRQLWCGRYESTTAGILAATKTTVPSAIMEGLNPATGSVSGYVPKTRYMPEAEAERDYQKGRYLQNKMTEADLGKSIAHFESAIAQEPRFALAHVGLADTYIRFATLGMLSPDEARRRAEELTTLSLDIDQALAEAHASLADIKAIFSRDYEGAEREYCRALQLNPSCMDGHRRYGAFLSAMGRPAEALAEIRRSQELDPLSLTNHVQMSRAYYFDRKFNECIDQSWQTLILEACFAPAQHILGLAYEKLGMYDDAITELQNACTCSGDDPGMLAGLCHAYAISGKPDRAREILLKLGRVSDQRYVSAYCRSIAYVGLGAYDLALEAIERGCMEREVWLMWLGVEPRFDPLRSDSRFDRLLEMAGFGQQ